MTEPPQRPRFGPVRQIPPDEVLKGLTGAAADTGWVVDQFGDDGGYPNGGIWQVSADRPNGAGPSSVWVKRTGASYLGDSRVWRCRFASDDPQWWGREAAFYESDLAVSGWPGGVRAARCYAIDDHDECRDLWLESVDVPAPLRVCERAASGLAGWQVAHLDSDRSWLAEDWIPTHVSRYGLDNERTLAHPAWPTAIDRGLDPVLRCVVEVRVTDPAEIRRQLQDFPQVLTHHDFHHANIGTVDEEVVIIDWAFVGWGPIGHDAGHLALDAEADLGASPSEAWHAMQSAYCDGLSAAGWSGDLDLVRRSMVVSNALRLGWTIDHFLSVAEQLSDDTFAAMSARMNFLAGLLELESQS
ncbi:phosphotransferase [Actinopolymorpha sp. B11F2]